MPPIAPMTCRKIWVTTSTMNGIAMATQALRAKRVYSAMTTAPTTHEPMTMLMAAVSDSGCLTTAAADIARKASQPPARSMLNHAA